MDRGQYHMDSPTENPFYFSKGLSQNNKSNPEKPNEENQHISFKKLEKAFKGKVHIFIYCFRFYSR